MIKIRGCPVDAAPTRTVDKWMGRGALDIYMYICKPRYIIHVGCKAERAHKTQLHVGIETCTCILIRKHTDKNEVKKLIFKIPKDKISLYINIFIKKN